MNNQEDGDSDVDPLTMFLAAEQEDDVDNSGKEDEGIAKQQLEQTYYIRSIESTVVIRQLPSQGLSFQLWPAATTLVTLLDLYRCQPSNSPLSGTLSALSNGKTNHRLRILELGSGTGLVGIAAAAILGANVTVTDLLHVIPNLQFNAELNSKVWAPHCGKLDVAPLKWGEADDMDAIGREFDLILGSDVVYHDHLYEPLLRTLGYLLLGGDEKRRVFLMAHLRRWKKESAFFKRAKKLFDVEIIHSDCPSIGRRVGVSVYRFVGKCKSLKADPPAKMHE